MTTGSYHALRLHLLRGDATMRWTFCILIHIEITVFEVERNDGHSNRLYLQYSRKAQCYMYTLLSSPRSNIQCSRAQRRHVISLGKSRRGAHALAVRRIGEGNRNFFGARFLPLPFMRLPRRGLRKILPRPSSFLRTRLHFDPALIHHTARREGMNDKKQLTKDPNGINGRQTHYYADGDVEEMDAQRIQIEAHYAQANKEDRVMPTNPDDGSRIPPSNFRPTEQNHFYPHPNQSPGGQYSFAANFAQTYYPITGNINAAAPYWTHYYPVYGLYPAQAGSFLPASSSYLAPQATHPSNVPTQPQQPLPKPTRSGTLALDEVPPNIPEPAQDYILNASLPPFTLAKPTRHLLILDLNGTLLYRPRNIAKERNADMRKASKNPILRPYLQDFMTYIFERFDIMFWSSAKPHNVEAMIRAATTPEQRERVLAIWDRDQFGLTKAEYNAKSLTIKDLNRVWRDRRMGGKKWRYGAANTVLLDDSLVKAAYQPHNHICVPEFLGTEGWEGDVALREVAGYLEVLRYQGDIARFIKQHPFRIGDGWVSPLEPEKLVG